MKNILNCLLIFINLLCYSQKNNINTLKIDTLSKPSNFLFLKKDLEEVNVILLGENTHHDGTTFKTRNELIKYLYDLGFKTIAFESGIYDVMKANNQIAKGTSIEIAMQKSLMGAWGYAKEFQNLWNFCKTKQDIKLVGFDNQFTGDYSYNYFVKDLYKFCDEHSLNLSTRENDFNLLIQSLIESNYYDDEDIPFNDFESSLNNLIVQINKLPNSKQTFYWNRIINSLLSLAKDTYIEQKAAKKIISFSVSEKDNIRDQQMAKNLLDYIKENPDEKIICLGANAHFTNTKINCDNKELNNFKPMGSYLKKALGKKLYSIATVTANDKFIFNGKLIGNTPIQKDSFEDLLLQQKSKHLFINADQDYLKTPIAHRLFSNDTFIKTPLNLYFDGYLFFKDWKEATYLSNNEEKSNEQPAEKIIEGTILEKSTNEPIPYATIKIPNLKSSYTYTNENGNYKLVVPENFSIDSLEIYSSFHITVKAPYKKVIKIALSEKINQLDEVIVTSKLTARHIVKKAIKNINVNYPIAPFNVKRYTILTSKINNKPRIDVEYISNEYSRGYSSKLRASYRLNQIKWNKNPYNKLKKLPLDNKNPLVGNIFKNNKLKKYDFKYEKDSIINKEEVYKISFSTTKKHYSYTIQTLLSDYYGTFYINKKNLAIVRFIQNWDIIEKDSLVRGHKYWFLGEGYQNKLTLLTKQKNILNFKKIDNLYYLDNQLDSLTGIYFYENSSKEATIQRKVKSKWFDYNHIEAKEIEFDKPWLTINNIKYNPDFWKSFNIK